MVPVSEFLELAAATSAKLSNAFDLIQTALRLGRPVERLLLENTARVVELDRRRARLAGLDSGDLRPTYDTLATVRRPLSRPWLHAPGFGHPCRDGCFCSQLGSAVCSMMVTFFQRWVEPAVSSRIVSLKSIRHRAQADAALQARRYTECMRREPWLLNMSVREFARRAEIHVIVAWAILRNPDVIPRPDLWRQIEKALLLPPEYFERNRSDRREYGNEMTWARLERYVTRPNMADIHVGLDVTELTDLSDPQAVSFVRRIEAQLLQELDKQEGGQ